MKAVTGVICGLGFGTALEKGSVCDPALIQAQMKMKRFSMMKMFLAGLASSSAIISGLLYTGMIDRLSPKPALVLANLSGGFILGTGMTMSGSCPGTVLAQLGSGIRSAPYVLAGGLAGVLAYGYLHPQLTAILTLSSPSLSSSLLSDALQVPHITLSLAMTLGLIGILYVVEKKVEKSAIPFKPSLDLSSPYWNEMWSGIVIGCMQLPPMVLLNAPLGTSSGYVGLLGRILQYIPGVDIPYIAGYADRVFPVVLDIGVILGAYLSSRQSGNYAKNQMSSLSSREKWMAVLGGFFMLFGARLANGCTSGHGISGVAQLALSSLLAMPMMFAGGMAAALFIK